MSIHELPPLKDGTQRWEVRVHLGNNEYRTKTIRGSRRDAEKYERSIRVKVDNEEHVPKKIRETFKEAGEAFLKRKAEDGKSTSYLSHRRGLLTNYIYPVIGHTRVNQVTDEVRREQVLVPLRNAGRGQDLIDRVSTTVSEVMLTCIRRKVLHTNPLERYTKQSESDKVTARFDAESAEMAGRAFTADEVRRVLAATHDPQARMFLALCFQTAIRHGEAAALAPSAVDFKDNAIHVRQSLSRRDKDKDGKRGVIKHGTKTTKSRTKKDPGIRTIPIAPEFAAELRAYIEAHPGALVFQNREGRPLDLNNFAKRKWAPALERAGIPYEPMYSTRHTAVSMWAHAGVPPVVIKELMGHSGASRILDRYLHAYASAKREAMVAHAAALRGPTPPSAPTPPPPAPESTARARGHSEKPRLSVIEGGKGDRHSEIHSEPKSGATRRRNATRVSG